MFDTTQMGTGHIAMNFRSALPDGRGLPVGELVRHQQAGVELRPDFPEDGSQRLHGQIALSPEGVAMRPREQFSEGESPCLTQVGLGVLGLLDMHLSNDGADRRVILLNHRPVEVKEHTTESHVVQYHRTSVLPPAADTALPRWRIQSGAE